MVPLKTPIKGQKIKLWSPIDGTVPKTDRSLEGSGEEITWQKGNRLTDLPGRVSPWNGQSGPPREAGGVCGRTTHGSHLRGCPKGNQKQTIDERGLLPRTSMGKNAIGPTEGKETKRERKVLSNSQVTVTRSKAMQTSPSVGQKVRSSSSRSRNRPCGEDQFSAPPKSGTSSPTPNRDGEFL